MGTVANLSVRISANVAEFERALSGLATTWSRAGAQMRSVGSSLTAGVTLPLAGMATVATKTGLEFESVMNQIKGVTQPTVSQLEAVRVKAIQMGAATKFSATDAATAMLEFSKAGFDLTTTITAADKVLQLAAASGLSMGQAAELSARTVAMFGLQTSDLAHVNDVLAAAVNASTLEINDLQAAFRFIGPLAQGVGMSVEQAAAAIAIMRDRGIAAETTGRTLREAFDALLNPTTAVKDVLAQLGVTLTDASGQLLPFDQIIQALEPHASNTGAMLKLFGNAAGPGMAALITAGSAKLNELTVQFQQSQGAAQAMADAMMTGLPGAFEQMRGSVETALIAISKALEPVLIPVLQWIGSLADAVTNRLVPAFQALPMPVQVGVVAIAALVAAIGPVLAVIGTLTVGITGLVTVFPSLGAVIAAVGGTMAALVSGAGAGLVTLLTTILPAAFKVILPFLGPAGLIAVAVGAVLLAWKHWDSISEIVQRVYTAVKTWLVDRFAAIVEGVKVKVDAVTGFFRDLYNKVVGQSYVPDLIRGIATEFGKLDGVMVTPVRSAASQIGSLFEGLTTKIAGLLGGPGSVLGNILTAGLGALFGPAGPLMSLVAAGLSALGGLVMKGLSAIGGFFKNVFGGIGGFFKDLFGGPSAEEMAGRELTAQFEANMASMLTASQRLVAGTETWEQAILVVQDAYLAAGFTAEEANRDFERMWAAQKQGGGAVQLVIDEITRKMQGLSVATAGTSGQFSGLWAQLTGLQGAFASIAGSTIGGIPIVPTGTSFDSGFTSFDGLTGGTTVNINAGTVIGNPDELATMVLGTIEGGGTAYNQFRILSSQATG